MMFDVCEQVVDRCNHTRAQRQFWYSLALQSKRTITLENIAVVHFDVSKDMCIERVRHRKGHPNLDAENAPDRVINRFGLNLGRLTDAHFSHTFCTL